MNQTAEAGGPATIEAPPRAAEDLARTAEEIQREIAQPAPGAAPPDDKSTDFPFEISTKGLWQFGVNGYARWRGKAFTLSPELAEQLSKPWDRLLKQALDRYAPRWAQENPELLAGLLTLGGVILQIESSPALPVPDAGLERPAAPASGSGMGFPTTTEIAREPVAR